MAGENVDNYTEQGGARTNFTGVVAHNEVDLAKNVAFTIGAEAADAIKVTIRLRKTAADPIANRDVVRCYLSDDVNGDDVTAAAPSGGVATGASGFILAEEVANIVWTQQTGSAGACDVDITEVGAKTFYLVIVLPDGRIAVSGAITFA